MGRECETRKTVQTTAAEKVLRGTSTTRNTALRAELGMHPLKTNRDIEKVEMTI